MWFDVALRYLNAVTLLTSPVLRIILSPCTCFDFGMILKSCHLPKDFSMRGLWYSVRSLKRCVDRFRRVRLMLTDYDDGLGSHQIGRGVIPVHDNLEVDVAYDHIWP